MNRYTAVITDTATLQEFALRCVENFFVEAREGEAILARDSAPGEYYTNRLDTTIRELIRLKEMTPAEIAVEMQKERNQSEEDLKGRNEDRARMRMKLERMLKMVQKWRTPSPEHEPLKNFMLSQICESIDFDCKQVRSEPIDMPTPKEWLNQQRRRLERNVALYRKEYAQETERIQRRNSYLRELLKSTASKGEKEVP